MWILFWGILEDYTDKTISEFEERSLKLYKIKQARKKEWEKKTEQSIQELWDKNTRV